MPDEVDAIGKAAEGDVVREAIALDKRRRALQAKLDPIEDRLKALQPQLVAAFERSGDQSRKVDGMTAYLRRELWVFPDEGVEREAAAQALKDSGLGDFVKDDFNVQSVSAFARELENEHGWADREADTEHPFLEQHPELKGKLKPEERFKVVIRK